jgi:hypothetical protein
MVTPSLPRLFAFLVAGCAPAIAAASAHADPVAPPPVPIGALCDAIAPVAPPAPPADDDDDDDDASNHHNPQQALEEKVPVLQTVLNRLQQNGGVSSGKSGAAVNDAVQGAQNGDVGAMLRAGGALAGAIQPQVPLTRDQDGGLDVSALESGPNQSVTGPLAQSTPLIDGGALATARNDSASLSQSYCTNVRQRDQTADQSDDGDAN